MADKGVGSRGQAIGDVPQLRLLAYPSIIHKKEVQRRVKFEPLFDLCFVTNIQILLEDNKVAEATDIANFIGFFSILWFTWFMGCMFDARFITDSLFERVIRILQFGSMVGFTVGIRVFKPDAIFPGGDKEGERQRVLFRNLSLILMAVRLSLVAQYCSAFWLHSQDDPRRIRNQVIKSRLSGWPILLAAAIHFIAATVYLGIAFRFGNIENHISKSYFVWYIGSAIEGILQFALAFKFDELLTFSGTDLAERLWTFTMVALGEAVNGITKAILLVSENGNEWSGGLTSIFVTAMFTAYLLYLLYFDWVNDRHLDGFRQLLYSLLHFPFHAALLLFGAGSALFIKWRQAVVIIQRYGFEIESRVDNPIYWIQSQLDSFHAENKSAAIAMKLNGLIEELNDKYPIQNFTLWYNLHNAVGKIPSIEDCYWNWKICNDTETDQINFCSNLDWVNCTSEESAKGDETWNISSSIYKYGIYDSIMNTFEINPQEDEGRNHENVSMTEALEMESEKFGEILNRVNITFQFFFACTGFILLLMTFFHVLTLTNLYRSPFDHVRVGLFAAVALALGLIPLMSTPAHRAHAVDYYVSPWILPTPGLAVFGVLVLTHIGRRPSRMVQWLSRLKKPRFFRKGRARQDGPHDDVEDSVVNERDDGRASRNYASLPSLERNGGH